MGSIPGRGIGVRIIIDEIKLSHAISENCRIVARFGKEEKNKPKFLLGSQARVWARYFSSLLCLISFSNGKRSQTDPHGPSETTTPLRAVSHSSFL